MNLLRSQKTQGKTTAKASLVKRFYSQELFMDQVRDKRNLFILMGIVAAGEIGKNFLLPDNSGYQANLAEAIIVYAMIIIAIILFVIAFSKRMEKDSTKYLVARIILLSIANLLICVHNFMHFEIFFSKQILNQEDFRLMDAIGLMATGVFIPLVMDLINPLWFMKILVPASYYAGFLFGAYKLEGDFELYTWIRFIIALIDITLVCYFRDSFRWMLFKKRVENEALNKIHEQILNNVPNPIAVFDTNCKIMFKNPKFDQIFETSFDTFSDKKVNLKIRREYVDINESETNIEIHKQSELILQTNLLSSPGRSESRRFKSFAENEEIESIKELLQKTSQLLTTGKLCENVYFVFDGKLAKNEEMDQEQRDFSFELTVSFMIEHQRIIFIFRDTTEQARIISLENNNDYKDRLLASVSHELRTPLNGNLTLIEAAMSSDEVSQSIKENFLTPALNSGKLLLHLINDILDFSQIAAKKLRLNFDQLSLKDTIKSCFQLVEIQTKKKGIDLQMRIDDQIGDFTTDHERVRQIILNLLSNAMKFTFQGSILLKAKILTPCHVKISVKDTGIGIGPENLAKLFKEFTRISNKEYGNINAKGVGLGLTIANKLARRLGPNSHQAGIKVKSEEKKGSCFSFVIVDQNKSSQSLDLESERDKNSDENSPKRKLTRGSSLMKNWNVVSFEIDEGSKVHQSMKMYRNPLSIQKNPRNETKEQLMMDELLTFVSPWKQGGDSQFLSPRDPLITIRKKKILIVDDEPFNILAMEAFLKGSEVNIETAFNGKEALEKVTSTCQTEQIDPFDLIFMDCQMPILDGFEATRALVNMMKKKEIPETPIIACTALNAKEAMEACLEVGMKEVINKPVSKSKLQQTLRDYFK